MWRPHDAIQVWTEASLAAFVERVASDAAEFFGVALALLGVGRGQQRFDGWIAGLGRWRGVVRGSRWYRSLCGGGSLCRYRRRQRQRIWRQGVQVVDHVGTFLVIADAGKRHARPRRVCA